MGTPASFISARAVLLPGSLTATVSRPAVTSSGTIELLLNIMVSGPGQKASARVCALSGTWLQSRLSSLFLAICSISGLSAGLPLARNMPNTASLSSPFAPRPYTVSVGNTTRPPSLIILPPSAVPFSYCVTAFAYCVIVYPPPLSPLLTKAALRAPPISARLSPRPYLRL